MHRTTRLSHTPPLHRVSFVLTHTARREGLKEGEGGGGQTNWEKNGPGVKDNVCHGVVGSGRRGQPRHTGRTMDAGTYKARTLEFLITRHHIQMTPLIITVLSITRRAGRPLGIARLDGVPECVPDRLREARAYLQVEDLAGR